MIIQSEDNGSITIIDDTKIYNIRPRLLFKRDSGHGGGSYVNGVILDLIETKRPPLNKEEYHKWKDRIESGR